MIPLLFTPYGVTPPEPEPEVPSFGRTVRIRRPRRRDDDEVMVLLAARRAKRF